MSSDLSAEITAVATAVLALFAFITAILAAAAFRKQRQEVRAIERQVKDEQELTRQQAELLKVQSSQLELQRHQADEQRKVNEQQIKVLQLQAQELQRSLKEREREAARRVRAQAVFVFLTEDRFLGRKSGPLDSKPPSITATVVNSSNQPITEAQLYWCCNPAADSEPNTEPLGTIMPGQSVTRTRKYPPDFDLDRGGAELTFRDADGIVFMRRPDGYLADLVVPVRAGSLNAAYRKEGV